MALDPAAVLVILAASAFTPPLIFLGVVRRTERYGREPLGRVLRTFLWGAIFAVILALIFSGVFIALFQEVDRVYVFSGQFPNLEIILLALVIAPFTEELAKGLGVYLARPMIDEPEDGLIYGAASGLGFAASENLVYGLLALTQFGSLEVSLLVIGVRSISSAFLHASSTAAFGYGIALRRLWPQNFRALPYYLLAVALHSVYNLIASVGGLPQTGLSPESAALLALLGAIVLAVAAFTVIRAKIRTADDLRVTW
ncbi:MAG: PrsW family intramembrane metalloprotease [Candidatus Thermoplasmatota archaeon]